MFHRKIVNAADVSRWRMCTGCGACTAVCPQQAISLADVGGEGLHAITDDGKCQLCGKCLEVCAGIGMTHRNFDGETIGELRMSWGPILEVWEGYAKDPQIRYLGSSGGAATALSLYFIEKYHSASVLHIGADKSEPLKNIAVLSSTRNELLQRTGSRYSPAAACEGFRFFGESEGPFVFVGKPCDVVALRKFQKIEPQVGEKAKLAISIFCAGTPSSEGTMALLNVFGVNAEEILEIRYRGCGWPGSATVKLKTGQERKMSYEQCWGQILSRFVPLRCRLCADSTGEFADISVGDPWYRKPEKNETGRSLLLVRTEAGRVFLREAVQSGYLELEASDPEVIEESQKSLLKKRKSLWGRIVAMRLMGVPSPRYRGFNLYANWADLPFSEKLRSVGGTIRRIVSRKWGRKLDLEKK